MRAKIFLRRCLGRMRKDRVGLGCTKARFMIHEPSMVTHTFFNVKCTFQKCTLVVSTVQSIRIGGVYRTLPTTTPNTLQTPNRSTPSTMLFPKTPIRNAQPYSYNTQHSLTQPRLTFSPSLACSQASTPYLSCSSASPRSQYPPSRERPRCSISPNQA